jgi:hypothetical protein
LIYIFLYLSDSIFIFNNYFLFSLCKKLYTSNKSETIKLKYATKKKYSPLTTKSTILTTPQKNKNWLNNSNQINILKDILVLLKKLYR